MISGNKDVDRMILNKLDDIDLVKFCQVNKKANKTCKDQVFWMNRVFQRFPEVPGDIFVKFKGNKSWSDYYIDLRKINKSNAPQYLLDSSKKGQLDKVIIALPKTFHDNDVNKALIGASLNNQLDIVKFLVNNKNRLNITTMNTALQGASSYGHLNIVKFLAENGADIHNGDEYALREASKNGNLDIVKYLVEHGANFHIRNDGPLRYARKYNHLEMVKYLEGL